MKDFNWAKLFVKVSRRLVHYKVRRFLKLNFVLKLSEDDEKQKNAVEKEDRVCDKVPLVAHVETVLKEPRGSDRWPQNNHDAEDYTDWVLKTEEEGAND